MSFEDKVDELPKETKNQLKNGKHIDDVADEVVKNFNDFQLKIQSLEERLAKFEWTPKTIKPADENDPCYKNKRNIYLGKLIDKLIKEPKQSTLGYYEVKYDDQEGIYY